MKYTALLMALVAAVSAQAGDAALGEQKAQTCFACHGPQGAKPIAADYPIIAGQPQDYLVRALLDYKSGARKNAIMAPLAAPLSKRDIENLAAYFSQQPSPLQIKR